ncbi:MAG: MFS transporter [Candidatus Heimdallarchaeota archaeon]|nr:MFS transporter [Candidatus Heimdallarchaeota archaeon]
MEQEQPLATSKSLRQYWIFFNGQLISLLGSSVVQFALIWWLSVTAAVDYPGQKGLILSLAMVAGFAPFVVTTLFSGVLVDRWNRKLVIMIADTAQAIITAGLMILFYLNLVKLPYILIILALRAVAQGFQNPAVQAIIPIMVPREKLTRVNSMEFLFNGLIQLIGPVIGATLIEWLGIDQMANILWIDVITFAIAVIPVLIIHIPDITKAKREAAEKPSFKSEFMEGINFLKDNNGLLTLLVTFTVINILMAPTQVLLPLMVLDKTLLAGTAGTLALIMAFAQGGSIVASFTMGVKPLFKNNAIGVVIPQFVSYIAIIFVALMASLGNLWGVVVFLTISGITMPLMNVSSQTIWQSCVPPELQGRVMSVRMVIAWVLIPVAQLFGGILSDYIGIVNVFYIGGIIGVFYLVFAVIKTDLLVVEEKLGLTKPKVVVDTEISPVTN